MAELQFKIDNAALDVVRSTPITANFDEMKEALTEFVKPYQSVIVTEDGISTAKSDRAKLRSVANHIDSYRKNVKAVYSEPLKTFEAKCKELTAIIDGGVSNLDKQVKEYEQKRKEEKLFLLHDYFDNAVSNMKNPDFIHWENVYNPKWENVTCKLEDCHKDIDLAIAKTESEVYAIKGLNSEFELSLLDCYKKEHNLSIVMQMHERLTEQKRQKEERERLEREQEELARIKAEQQAVNEQAEPESVGEEYSDFSDLEPDFADLAAEAIAADETAEIPFEAPPETYVATFKVYGTKQELESLMGLFKNLRVRHEVVGVQTV